MKAKKYRKLDVKLSYFFIILILLIALVVGNLVYFINYNNTVNYSKSLMARCGRYVNEIVSARMVKFWLDDGPDASYNVKKADLEAIKNVFKIAYLYVYRPETDKNGEMTGVCTFIYDLNPEEVAPKNQYKLGETINLPEIQNGEEEFSKVKALMETGEEQYTFALESALEGDLMTVFVPVMDDENKPCAVIGVCFPMENIKNQTIKVSILMVVVFEAVIVIFGIILLRYIRKRVVAPVKMLSGRMDNFVSSGSQLSSHDPIKLNTHDELEQMTDNFNSMAESILQYTSDLKNITAAQAKLRAELDVAGSLRSAMSAETSFPAFSERSDFELYASMKNTVYNSCSFCNYFLVDEDHLFIVMGESVGKTLPSMLMSMLASTNISALAKMKVEPYRIAYETNNGLCGFDQNSVSMTVSALIAEIDLSAGVMKYVNAGMPPIIIKESGEPYVCEEEEMHFNLGEMRGSSFTQKTIRLTQGSTLFFTSYGVHEMKDSDGQEYSEKRLTGEINRIAGENYPIKEMISEIERSLDEFRRGSPLLLDTTILGFRYLG